MIAVDFKNALEVKIVFCLGLLILPIDFCSDERLFKLLSGCALDTCYQCYAFVIYRMFLSLIQIIDRHCALIACLAVH